MLSKKQWIEILEDSKITNKIDLAILQALYSFENKKASSSQIGRLFGYTGKNPQGAINLEIGRYAKRIAKKHDINFSQRKNRKYKYWDLFFNGWEEKDKFSWQIKDELISALEQTHLTGIELLPEEIPNTITLNEGIKKTITINTYERNPKARSLCIDYWKPICSVCNFNFEEKYGELGKGFIHVHHLIPISKIGKNYEINPIDDLRPLCPNCHAMIHKKNPPLTIKELKNIIEKK